MPTVYREEALVPRPRSLLPVVCTVAVGLGMLLIVFWLDSNNTMERIKIFAVFPITTAMTIHSVCLFVEEWLYHLNQRYHGRIIPILQSCFEYHVVLGIFLIFILILTGHTPSRENWGTITLLCGVCLLLKGFGFMGPAPVEISDICEVRKMNVAHGLAWSFYLGYLKLILPDLQSKVDGCLANGKQLSSRRLHILLPLSAVVQSTPGSEDSNVVFLENLPELELDRAGVQKRSYKNSVYTITDQNQTFRCVLEYATPLLTLYQMSQESSAGFGERERKHQVLLFYRTLSQILESSLECQNRYRLILLDDEQAGDPHYLSREIIQHLKQQDREIHVPQMPNPISEEGEMRRNSIDQRDDFMEEMSSDHTLMISRPRPLRVEPVETTENFNHVG